MSLNPFPDIAGGCISRTFLVEFRSFWTNLNYMFGYSPGNPWRLGRELVQISWSSDCPPSLWTHYPGVWVLRIPRRFGDSVNIASFCEKQTRHWNGCPKLSHIFIWHLHQYLQSQSEHWQHQTQSHQHVLQHSSESLIYPHCHLNTAGVVGIVWNFILLYTTNRTESSCNIQCNTCQTRSVDNLAADGCPWLRRNGRHLSGINNR